MKIVLIINIPAPYRVPVFEKVSERLGENFTVIFAAKSEPNRSWNNSELKFQHIFLNESYVGKKDGFNFVHNNIDVLKHLWKINPDIIITTGFNPTHLYGWFFAKILRKKHIYMTDGTISTERHLSLLHRLLRKIVFSTSHAFIGPGIKTRELFNSYEIPNNFFFQSQLAVDNDRFRNVLSYQDREYDLMFSGNFIDIKQPLFFVEIVERVLVKQKNLKVLVIGDGPLREEFLEKLKTLEVEYSYPGFIKQEDIPSYYRKVKLFLFTTKHDAWGVVANEALASGTPVLVTPFAGVSGDLVKDQYNGFVLPQNSKIWAERIIDVLKDVEKWRSLSEHAHESVGTYTFDNAANGIIDACQFVMKNK